MLVRIINTPPGEAPEEIRAAWVGLVLPVADAMPGPTVLQGFGVLSGKPYQDAAGQPLDSPHYVIPAATAVVLLDRKNPAVAAWWRENAPHTIQPGQVFGFAAEVCEQIPAGDGTRQERSSETLLEVTYSAKLSDLVECSMQMLKRSSAGRRELGCGWVGLTGGFVAIGVLLLLFLHWVPSLVCGILAIYFVILYPLIYRRGKERAIRQYLESLGTQGLTGPVTLTITEDTLTYRTETTTTTVRWRDMNGVQDLGDAIFLQVNSLSAAVLPRRRFERGDEYDAVRDFALAVLPRIS